MLIKICGMRDEANTKAIAAAGPDMLGFIFYAGSKRAVDASTIVGLLEQLPKGIQKVAVCVGLHSAKAAEIYQLGFDYLQLHGGEDADYCRALKAAGVSIIKAFQVDAGFEVRVTEAYQDYCAYFLFDTASAQPGGSGRSFDWSLLQAYAGTVPFLLSGGLGLQNLEAAMALRHPRLVGLDFNSRLETAPAIKDIIQTSIIINKIKEHDQNQTG